jgi:hypothetical protein
VKNGRKFARATEKAAGAQEIPRGTEELFIGKKLHLFIVITREINKFFGLL